MADLHWSVRKELERMMEDTKDENIGDRPDQESIAKASTPQEIIDAIVGLVEHQRYRFAKAALEDQSKYPQRMEGCAKAYNTLLERDLYPIQELMQQEKIK